MFYDHVWLNAYSGLNYRKGKVFNKSSGHQRKFPQRRQKIYKEQLIISKYFVVDFL